MSFIRNNLKLVGVIASIVLAIVVVVMIIFNTNIFNTDAQLVDEISENIDEETGEAIVSSNVEEVEVPKEIEGLVDSDISEERLNGEHGETFKVWEDHQLDYEDGDDQIARDIKGEARVNLYKNKQTLEENGGKYNGVEYDEESSNGLGWLFPDESEMNSEYLFNTDNVTEIGDIEVLDMGVSLEGVHFIVRNNGDITTRNEISDKLKVNFGDAQLEDDVKLYSGEEEDTLVGTGMYETYTFSRDLEGGSEVDTMTQSILDLVDGELSHLTNSEGELEDGFYYDMLSALSTGYSEEYEGNSMFFGDYAGEITYEEFVDMLPNSYAVELEYDGNSKEIQVDKANEHNGYNFEYEQDKRS